MLRLDSDKEIIVTGGSGFLGSHVMNLLYKRGYKNLWAPSHSEFDFTEESGVRRMFNSCYPGVVIHLAAVCGGIGANQKQPGKFFYDNIKMGIEMIDQAYNCCVDKFVQVGTVCAYPKFTPTPFKEEDIWNGYPEETNAPYGIAKKALLVQCQAYRAQYGFNAIYLVPVNLYGPRDNFDPGSSHVIPALIKKCLEAKKNKDTHMEVWGTGKASREFLYVEDCAKAIVSAMELYDGAEPVNIGTGSEITIMELVDLIKEITGCRAKVCWQIDKPDGQPSRRLDTTKAKEKFNFEATTRLREGLKKTVEWYISENPSLHI